MTRDVTTWHLELNALADLVPARPARVAFDLRRVGRPAPEFARFFYTAVGGDWFWVDRLGWTLDAWRARMADPAVAMYVASVDDAPAGYFELERQAESVEIVYFGVLPDMAGQGLGGALLEAAARAGFALGASRVWVHTCDMDHQGARGNYEARGFRLFRTEHHTAEFPDAAPGPWPGAR